MGLCGTFRLVITSPVDSTLTALIAAGGYNVENDDLIHVIHQQAENKTALDSLTPLGLLGMRLLFAHEAIMDVTALPFSSLEQLLGQGMMIKDINDRRVARKVAPVTLLWKSPLDFYEEIRPKLQGKRMRDFEKEKACGLHGTMMSLFQAMGVIPVQTWDAALSQYGLV